MNYLEIIKKAFYVGIISVIIGIFIKYFMKYVIKINFNFITLFLTSFFVYIIWNILKMESFFDKKLNNEEHIHPASYK
jgi:hypothetical protein